jgi:hypothetical protein
LLAGLGEGKNAVCIRDTSLADKEIYRDIYSGMGHRERQEKAQIKRKSNRQFIYDNPLQELRISGPKDGKET